MDKEINRIIDKTYFKTYERYKDHVRKQIPNISDEQLRKYYKLRVKDPYVNKKKIRNYQLRIFSKTHHTWFHDLLDNGKNSSPRYFHIFIGTNNRFACSIPIENKNANAIKNSLDQFLSKHRCLKLTSDEESVFLSEVVLNFLKSRNILVHTVIDKNHSTLGIIDRFIRTLRDMNTPRESSKSQSNDDKYKSFTNERMQKLIDIYNNTYHSSIKMSPRKMYENPELEKEYIFKMIREKEKRIGSLNDFELQPGDLVRYILPRNDGLTKKRYRYSKEYYKIDSKNGSMYNLIASDGKSIVKPRFLLRKLLPNEISRMKFAKTIEGRNAGVIEKVIENAGDNKVCVLFAMPNGEEYEDVIPKSYLRSRFNQTDL